MRGPGIAFLAILPLFFAGVSRANDLEVRRAYGAGQYFTAARIAFNEANRSMNPADKAMSYAWAAESLVRAGLDQSAIYFFLRTLQMQERNASRKVLELAPLLIERAGTDFLKKFLIRYTKPEEYSPQARNAFDLAIAKDRLVRGDDAGAIRSASLVDPSHSLYPLALQIKGVAEVNLKRTREALADFALCAEASDQRNHSDPGSIQSLLEKEQGGALTAKWDELRSRASGDLKARCIADQARVLYETGRFEEADRKYDAIPKASFVWTDTLFEHAWNSYAREEYNRTLGKLVSYKSPSLQFAFNSEVDVLMAQSYAALCLYGDSAKIIEEFSRKSGTLARDVRTFIEQNPSDARPYFLLGRKALQEKLHSGVPMNRFLNRFVRSPTFEAYSLSLDRVLAEKVAIQRLDALRSETSTGMKSGFPGFLNSILDWRIRTIQLLGGVFIRNSMVDYHEVLISDLEKIQFMKIDVLSRMKDRLQAPDLALTRERTRGNRSPVRRSDQILFDFNGEFWNDEIGDYVFALESDCGKGGKNAR